MTRNKLITFCYLFIVGIGFAMAFTAGPEALPALWSATAILGLLTLAGFVAVHRFRKPVDEELAAYGPVPADPLHISLWVLLLLTALVFGYTRYIAMIRPPRSPPAQQGCRWQAHPRCRRPLVLHPIQPRPAQR